MLQLLQLLVQFVGLLLEPLLALLLIGLEGLEFLFETCLRIVCDVHGRLLMVVASLRCPLGLLLLDHISHLLALLLEQTYLLMLKLQLLVVLSVLVLKSLVHVLGLPHLVVKLVQFVAVLLILATDVVKGLILLLRDSLHGLGVAFEPIEFLSLVFELVLQSVDGVDIVGGFKLLPHFRYFLLQLLKGPCLLLNLLVLVLQGCVRFQLVLYLGPPLLLKLSDLAVHLVDDLKEFCLEFLIYLDHPLDRGVVVSRLRWLQGVANRCVGALPSYGRLMDLNLGSAGLQLLGLLLRLFDGDPPLVQLACSRLLVSGWLVDLNGLRVDRALGRNWRHLRS